MSYLCSNCNIDQDKEAHKTQWWHCRDYFGISGIFCGKCYSLIAHDCYKNPINLAGYNTVLKKVSR